MFQIKTAERKNVKLKLGISAASGHGKTYSALLLAKGLVGGNLAKVGLIDTENGSGALYAHLGAYQHLDFHPPYSPDRYVAAIDAMAKQPGIEAIIVDSTSHEWDGAGGCLEIVERLRGTGGNRNDFAVWAKVTPLHKKFIDAILQCPKHVIVTTRRKQEYVLEKNDRGKEAPRKVGMKEIQREGFEYELTVNFELTQEHYALASKDRTDLFNSPMPFLITEETGAMIRAWNESGAAAALQEKKPAAAPAPAVVPTGPTMKQLHAEFCQLFPSVQFAGLLQARYNVQDSKSMTPAQGADLRAYLIQAIAEGKKPAAAPAQEAPPVFSEEFERALAEVPPITGTPAAAGGAA